MTAFDRGAVRHGGRKEKKKRETFHVQPGEFYPNLPDRTP